MGRQQEGSLDKGKCKSQSRGTSIDRRRLTYKYHYYGKKRLPEEVLWEDTTRVRIKKQLVKEG